MKKINNNSLSIKDVGKTVELFGFIANKRKMGEISFVDLRDQSGIVQILFKQPISDLTKESIIKVIGIVEERKDKNPQLATGDIEIIVDKYELLSKSKNELPFVVRDDVDVKEETRLEYRYLDLRRPVMKKIFKTRHQVIKSIRDFLDKNEFLEIETPILSKSTPEGARDFLVPTRNKNHFFALPQSPQLYKQLLMVSGFEKYFQIARVFRDEDSRKDRQPEFTQLDIEMAYQDEESVKSITEKMFEYIFDKQGIKIQIPFARMDYDHAMNTYGTDKPDLRYNLELVDVKKYFANTDFNILKSVESIKMIHLSETLSKKDIKILEEVAKKNKAKGLLWATFNNEEKEGPGFKFFEKELLEIINDKSLNNGSFLFIGDKNNFVNQALGAVRIKLAEMFSLAKDELNFVWIENWPLFEIDDDSKEMHAMHHPFTAPTDDSLNDFDKNPLQAKARSYDITLNGFEIGGGSVRINDLDTQTRMFKAIGMSEQLYESQFGYFLNAFKYGIPPHMGIAFGIDRLIMILEKTDSIRDVIAFPKSSSGVAVLESSPSQITEKQAAEYNIKLLKEEE